MTHSHSLQKVVLASLLSLSLFGCSSAVNPAPAPKPDEVVLSAPEQRAMNVFLSTFSETGTPSFKEGAISDDILVRFAVLHTLTNDWDAVRVLPDGVTGEISAETVDVSARKYFGLSPQQRSGYPGGTELEITFEGGSYRFPLADGETFPFTHVVRVTEMPDGLLGVDATLYQPASPESDIDYYGLSIDEIRAQSEGDVVEAGVVRAILKRKTWEGQATYELLSYEIDQQGAR